MNRSNSTSVEGSKVATRLITTAKSCGVAPPPGPAGEAGVVMGADPPEVGFGELAGVSGGTSVGFGCGAEAGAGVGLGLAGAGPGVGLAGLVADGSASGVLGGLTSETGGVAGLPAFH